MPALRWRFRRPRQPLALTPPARGAQNGDCFFLAALASLAKSGKDLQVNTRIRYQGHFHYSVTLFDSAGKSAPFDVKLNGFVTDDDPRAANLVKLHKCSFWTILYSRAFDALMNGKTNGGLIPNA